MKRRSSEPTDNIGEITFTGAVDLDNIGEVSLYINGNKLDNTKLVKQSADGRTLTYTGSIDNGETP